ncbi:hypothetical protein GCM10010218_22780 [Streptomyces mashuensis]|uniref:Uncharacterized protein n=1 Tax=Streptomyces mashuensis TaxID=33904 RepID=A0A919B338_9ACTN|nr:DUF6193 family natural product biosynthesis protein [Streptomyces mashuensis]GHF40810.1 hypothetical protein GCM10010218_22780 [Streptomyces mashuensis]
MTGEMRHAGGPADGCAACGGGGAADGVVDRQWRHVLGMDAQLVEPSVVRALYGQPRLRELFPVVSHGVVYLSRRAEHPWTDDVPVLHRRAGGGFVVIRHSDGVTLGESDSLQEAVGLVVGNLPTG